VENVGGLQPVTQVLDLPVGLIGGQLPERHSRQQSPGPYFAGFPAYSGDALTTAGRDDAHPRPCVQVNRVRCHAYDPYNIATHRVIFTRIDIDTLV